MLEAFTVSTLMVALAEMGDKTQLLSLCLACRFHRPLPIILGILAATLFNHALAALTGATIASFMGKDLLQIIIGLSFIGMGLWILVPDKDDDVNAKKSRHGLFVTTFIAFFMAEMGDKTQIATVALAGKYQDLAMVVAGTTLGMMLANVPVVYLGKKMMRHIPLILVRRVVCGLFLAMGALAFFPFIKV